MTAAALAKEIVPPGEEEAWHLPDSAWSTPLGVQVLAGDWGMNGTTTGASRRVLGAENRDKALIALADVSAQGEGPGGTTTGDSHFARFFSIFDGTNGVVRFPGPGWEPVRPVPRDPVLPERVQGGGSAITDPVAQAWARVGDASYALLLGLIPHYLLSPAAERRHFASAAVRREMKGHLLDARAFLNERPHTAGGLDRAELPFSLPETVNLPVETTARRAALMARYDLALERLASLKDVLHAAGRDGDYPAAWEAEWQADRDAV